MSESSSDEDEGLSWDETLECIKRNDPRVKSIERPYNQDYFQDMTDEEWEELGRDISNNIHLNEVNISYAALNDHKMSFLFRGLTRSSSIEEVYLNENELSVAGVRSMVPFLQNANNLTELSLGGNDIQSEGFNILFRALSGSPIKRLDCSGCGIKSIEIDIEHVPRHLKDLNLSHNEINPDGYRGLATLLRGENATLRCLRLNYTNIDDERVQILMDALQSNKSLTRLELMGAMAYNNRENVGVTDQGLAMLLKLVCNVSSIEAMLQSNHTLDYSPIDYDYDEDDDLDL